MPQNAPEQFERALYQEAERVHPILDHPLDSLFLGGGTPSMTPAESIERALQPLELQYRLTSKTEWTLEANPSSINRESLKKYLELGINRISIGIQSLDPNHLKILGRVHSPQVALDALNAVFESGLTNVSVDLLCGVPDQSLNDLEFSLKTLTQYPITHLSCYLLTLSQHHPLFSKLPNEDTQLSHLLFIDQWMTQHGFEHYEISNFAKPSFESKHNLNYWKGGSYLGMGPSAHSFDAALRKRWKNISSLHQYVSRLSLGDSVIEWSENLSESQQNLEKWMLALRLAEGFPTSWLDQPHQEKQAEALQNEGLLTPHPTLPERLRLTPRGFALSDQVIAMLT